ncbi:MAG: hypothetical protein M3P08_18630 [Thermoproteota archaeon]|nr:hypothetical protein [Thermoproteota archaeon]
MNYLYLPILVVLGITLSMTITPSLISGARTNIALAQPSSTHTSSNNTNFLSYDSKPPYTQRSAAAEWTQNRLITPKNGGIRLLC